MGIYMKLHNILSSIVFTSLFLFCSSLFAQRGFQMGEKAQAKLNYRKAMTTAPLQKKMGEPKPGEWLSLHKEPGQTYEQYIAMRPVLPRGRRKYIYIQPIGKFSMDQGQIIRLTAEFVKLYFGLDVKISKGIDFGVLPVNAERTYPGISQKEQEAPPAKGEKGKKDKKAKKAVEENIQVSTKYILDDILIPRIPEDAAAYLGITARDLWPGKDNWNFVFGQASLTERVGVWSIYRNGNPKTEFALVLERTLKTAVHEMAHMFSFKHCIEYECCMNGSNSREESDSRPLWLCPQCLTKMSLISKNEMRDRFTKLKEFCEKNKLTKEAEYYQEALKLLSK